MNRLGYSLVIIVIFLASSQQLFATAFSQDYKFRLNLTGSQEIKPTSLIRVRVFPHTKSYKPHGRDTDLGRVAFVSDEPCTIYAGAVSRAKKTREKIGLSNRIELDARTLNHPMYVSCKSPVTIERGVGVPHFTYKGDLYVRVLNRRGAKVLEVINIVTLKNYLKGVVPSEVYSAWPMETLKTQAVAARTYAIFHVSFSRRFMKKKRLWDVDDTIAYQAYTGIDLNTPRTDAAVSLTEGQILTHDGAIIQAYYHADSGGQTEDAVNVWDINIPYVQGRKESFDFEVASSSWRKTLKRRTVQSKLRRLGVLEKGEQLKSLAVPFTGRTDSGRVRTVMLGLGGDKTKLVDIATFKKAAGNLPSTLFAFEEHPTKQGYFYLKGLGSGHGVGMSQQGAAILASNKGWSYDQILDYYYTDTTLCRLGSKDENLPDCYGIKQKVPDEDKLNPTLNAS